MENADTQHTDTYGTDSKLSAKLLQAAQAALKKTQDFATRRKLLK